MIRVMRNNNERYPEGYKPKIDYWNNRYYDALLAGIEAYNRGDRAEGVRLNEEAVVAMNKVSYFMRREEERVEKMNNCVEDIWVF
jgi:hypothetical protein